MTISFAKYVNFDIPQKPPPSATTCFDKCKFFFIIDVFYYHKSEFHSKWKGKN